MTNKISYLQVLDASNRVLGHRDGINCGNLEKQLALSLGVYKERGEFDGTMKSAIECLILAEYELDAEILYPNKS